MSHAPAAGPRSDSRRFPQIHRSAGWQWATRALSPRVWMAHFHLPESIPTRARRLVEVCIRGRPTRNHYVFAHAARSRDAIGDLYTKAIAIHRAAWLLAAPWRDVPMS